MQYLGRFIFDGAGWLLLPAALAWREKQLWPGAVFAALFSAYVVAVGGDVFAHGRFLLPVLPTLSVLAGITTVSACVLIHLRFSMSSERRGSLQSRKSICHPSLRDVFLGLLLLDNVFGDAGVIV